MKKKLLMLTITTVLPALWAWSKQRRAPLQQTAL